jgi:hypothetical protein
MSASRCPYLAAAIVAVALFTPPAVRAQQSWTLCTPGALRSCGTIFLSTTPVFSGSTRTGTGITVSMRNLNGQFGLDNSIWSGFTDLQFWGNSAGQGGGLVSTFAGPITLSGTATGSAPAWLVQSYGGTYPFGGFPAGGALVQVDMNSGGANYYVGGCTPSPISLDQTTVMTCGGSALTSISYSTAAIFDSWDFSTAYVAAVGDYGSGLTSATCETDSQAYGPAPGYYANCDIFGYANVAPEPGTLLLLATGLTGIGGVRLRRRMRPLG